MSVFELSPSSFIQYEIREPKIVWIKWIQAPPGEGVNLLTTFEEKKRIGGYEKIQLETCAGGDEDGPTILRRFAFFQKMDYKFVGLTQDDLPTTGLVMRFKREKVL